MNLYEDDMFDKAFDKHVKGIEEHTFKHYNSSMGCHIRDKRHYKEEMKRRGMVPYDEMEKLCSEWDNNHRQKEYGDLSPKAMEIISSAKMSADKHGNVKLGGRAIEAMIEIGAINPRHEHVPDTYIGKGGFG